LDLEHTGEGAIVYFLTLACALSAVHGLVDFTVRRLQRHGQLVSQLAAEHRARERELQLAAQLEEAQRLEALGRLAGGIAHDFNNLLTVLIGCAEVAETSLASNPSLATRSLRDLQVAAGRGASLTSQLLDFARRRPAQPRNVDLNPTIVSAAQLLEHLLEAEIELRVRTCAEPCVVHIDPSGLERVLLNLAVNARDAMPEGGTVTLALAVRERDGVEQVVLEVSDTGIGMASQDLAHIFEPFFTTKGSGRGTGLGLASVYGIVTQSQGQIEVDSSPGGGTTFRLRWPRVHESPEPSPAQVEVVGGRELLLLVDDNAEVRLVAFAHLSGAGYEVLSASSGEEALALLKEHEASVRMIVSDVSMPGMSGVELAGQVRVRHPKLPILLISGYSDELHGKSARLAHYLAKPFSGQQLLLAVRRALDGEST
ncbi:MAG TPA: ATP-binding protein, partial [Polyangiaceae bacterium]|nr:ATP-binding protein [Polyangiaceae bacterium]